MLLNRPVARPRAHRAASGDDSGSALVAVIAVLAVAAVIAATLVTATVYSAGFTSATRASVQSRAAAEAGIDAVVAGLRLDDPTTCPSGGEFTRTDPPEYSVQLQTPDGTGGWTDGCPVASTESVRFQSTGYAEADGAAGHARGDESTMEAVFTVNREMPPEFPRALVGDRAITTSAATRVTAPSGPADLVTNGDLICSGNMNESGMVYIGGNLIASAACAMGSPAYVGGGVTCSAGLWVRGDLSVRGNYTASAQCLTDGRLWVGGTVTTSAAATVGGDLWVWGALYGSVPPVVDGSAVRVRGALGFSRATYGTKLTHPDTSVTVPTGVPGYDPAANAFPRLTADDPRWAGWHRDGWRAATQGVRSGGNGCGISSTWPGTLTITTDTVLDSRTDCSSGLSVSGGGLRIALRADLVILVNEYSQSGGTVTVTSADGADHSVYLVRPWTSAGTTCSSTNPGVRFSGGDWSQPDGKSRIMVYSAAGVTNSSSVLSLRGQVYACSVTDSGALTVDYAPVGRGSTSSASGGPVLELVSKRDVTG